MQPTDLAELLQNVDKHRIEPGSKAWTCFVLDRLQKGRPLYKWQLAEPTQYVPLPLRSHVPPEFALGCQPPASCPLETRELTVKSSARKLRKDQTGEKRFSCGVVFQTYRLKK